MNLKKNPTTRDSSFVITATSSGEMRNVTIVIIIMKKMVSREISTYLFFVAAPFIQHENFERIKGGENYGMSCN